MGRSLLSWWLRLATQEKRPELRELYRERLIEAYRKELED